MSKKIAIVTPVFPPYHGGIGAVAQNHARLLAERGMDVTVFTPNYRYTNKEQILKQACPELDSRVQNDAFKVELLKPVVKSGNAAYVPQLEHLLRDYEAVILQYPFFGGMRAVYKAKKRYAFKLIVYYHMDVLGIGLKGLVFWYATKFFLPRIVKAADIILASSYDYARHSDLRAFWKDNNQKFKILPIGVDASLFHPEAPDEEFRKNLNIAPEEKIVLFVGGLDKAHYFKGVEYLIQAIRKIQDGARFRVVIAGRGELQARYQKLAEDLGVKDKVLFTGGISDKYLVKLYQAAEVAVLPSIDRSEAFGIVLVEAMACSTPVIASDLPGVRSVFDDKVSGFVVPVKDIKKLSEKISYIINHPYERREMGTAARQKVLKQYDWNSIGDSLLSLGRR